MSDLAELGSSKSHCPEGSVSTRYCKYFFLSSVLSFIMFCSKYNYFLFTLRLHCYILYKSCKRSRRPFAGLTAAHLDYGNFRLPHLPYSDLHHVLDCLSGPTQKLLYCKRPLIT
jgi:hypothetical protein